LKPTCNIRYTARYRQTDGNKNSFTDEETAAGETAAGETAAGEKAAGETAAGVVVVAVAALCGRVVHR